MGRKIGFGLLWFVIIYLGSCALVGGIAGALDEGNDAQSSFEAGKAAGAAAVAPIRIYLFFGATTISIIGAIKGFLPGTKKSIER